ncbi:MAG: hypothetical protein C4527_18825 [Candidatus Omnitrophota bacterium]|nr:MAG: hypothetical protein C4527_18825 [Candidatus Omnitrophota bacterium]
MQIFGFTYELAGKTLEDLLFYKGFIVKTPREAIRKAFEVEYLDEAGAETLSSTLVLSLPSNPLHRNRKSGDSNRE